MYRFVSALIIFCFLIASFTMAGVIKESKTTVAFRGFGEFSTHSTVRISGDQKREDTEKDFKGEGFLGGITAKILMSAGKHSGEITRLDAMQMVSMNHEKKEYRVMPIKKLSSGDYTGGGETDAGRDEQPSEEEERSVRIIRSEFKVSDTGERKNINDFPAQKYTILWLTEWENTDSGERGTDSLFTVVWTTKPTADMKAAQEEEMEFQKAYMEKIGLDMDAVYQDMLGMSWLSMFKAMNQNKTGEMDVKDEKALAELKKIEGYPVVIDGGYYMIRPGSEEASSESSPNAGLEQANKMLGGLFGKAMGKKSDSESSKSKSNKAAFTYYTELVKLSTGNVDGEKFTVPADYQNVGEAGE